MRIVQQPFTEQEIITVLGTNLRTMSSKATNKATTGDEEQIRIIIRQMGKSIKGKTIDSHKHRSREAGSFIKLHPVGVVVIGMVIGHDTLNYFQTSHPSFYTTDSVKDVSLLEPQNNRMNEERRTNVGLMKMMGEDVERPGIGSNHTLIFCSLHNPIQNNNLYRSS
jgi:hypothetical protein